MTSAAHRINALLYGLAKRFRAHTSEIAALAASRMMNRDKGLARLMSATTSASNLVTNITSGSNDDILKLIHNCYADLHWKPPGFGKLPIEISQNMAVTEIIGPLGIYPATDLRVGLLLQNEHLTYPSHKHSAEELYLVLSGEALWAVNEQPPQPRKPGSFVHHKPDQPHAMITRDQPLLAAWVWAGEITAETYHAG